MTTTVLLKKKKKVDFACEKLQKCFAGLKS